jgi:acylphosphatase
MYIARKFFIRGTVQGVGFRFFTQRSAARHQVTGYVRNLPDGRVEAFVQGGESFVEAFKHDLAAGPRYAKIDELEEIVSEPDRKYSTFRIER